MLKGHLQRKDRKKWQYFFPIQLLILHVKKNHFLLLLWGLLFAFVLGFFAPRFGVPQQFLVPEYMGQSGIAAFGMVGFALGGFITGFNLYTYIMHGYRFPFIATLSRPFQKFSLNNFILPSLFIITYCIYSASFQIQKEFFSLGKVMINLVSFVIGVMLFQMMSYLYFTYTNKDAKAFIKERRLKVEPVESPLHHRSIWYKKTRTSRWHVETYMSSLHKINLARDSGHYTKAILEQVFSQNHINAARFELVLVISFLLVGFLRVYEHFIIPAAASLILLFTMILMLLSAFHSWIKGWTLTIIIVLLVVLNFFHKDLRWLTLESKAIGMNYETGRTPYQPQHIQTSELKIREDISSTEYILNKWKAKTNKSKPMLVIVDCSGGGSRSAYWTMRSLQYANRMCNSELLQHTVLFTGASGGMFGAAYMRELMLAEQLGVGSVYDTVACENMAKDLLNPVVLSLATNDWFFRFQKVDDGNFSYSADRATAFEEQFHRNTGRILDKRLSDYTQPEREAVIPMMVLSPTIVNDGRRLLISAQPMSYLTKNMNHTGLPEDIEFTSFFRQHEPERLQWLTALRMNATFPYIFPMTSLPSEPAMDIMDAGIRDNFGMKTTAQFLHSLQSWIGENCSGVIILQVRDLPKFMDLGTEESSLFSKFTAPLGSIYGNMTKGQDYNNDQMLEYLRSGYPIPIHLISFELAQTAESHVSLSWHLTQSEKKHIREATKDNLFLQQLEVLRALIRQDD